jgi:hypothetical protein
MDGTAATYTSNSWLPQAKLGFDPPTNSELRLRWPVLRFVEVCGGKLLSFRMIVPRVSLMSLVTERLLTLNRKQAVQVHKVQSDVVVDQLL